MVKVGFSGFPLSVNFKLNFTSNSGHVDYLLLRSLAFNISGSSEQLDMKQCADVLYSMAVFNISDSVLVSRVRSEVDTSLGSNKDKSTVIGLILTSFGILKYRTDRLDARTLRDLSLTLATVNYLPRLFKK
jgi:hypothetical protein